MMNLNENKLKEIDRLKKEIDSYRPLDKHELHQLKKYYRISLAYTSNPLEGNSLTETETKIVIEDGLTIGGKPLKDHNEAVGHSKAYDLVHELLEKSQITEENILDIHKLFYHSIDLENAGKYRKKQVFISGTEFVPPSPEQVTNLMKKFVASMSMLQQKHHPVEFAA